MTGSVAAIRSRVIPSDMSRLLKQWTFYRRDEARIRAIKKVILA
jgi:hypothetical protein